MALRPAARVRQAGRTRALRPAARAGQGGSTHPRPFLTPSPKGSSDPFRPRPQTGPRRSPNGSEAVARQVADTLGLGAFTESSVGPSPFDETRILGNFSADDTYFGTPMTHLISMTVYPGDMALNPEAPLSVTFGLWNAQATE